MSVLMALYIAALILLAIGSSLVLYGAWVCAQIEADVEQEKGQ